MHPYQYRAIDRYGTIHNSVIDAKSMVDLEARLSHLGLELISCRKHRGSILPRIHNNIARRDLVVFCYHLEQTCRAGVPILESLSDMRDSTENTRLRDITAAMIVAIEGGSTLAGAMQDHPAVFNEIFCSLIRAGEQSGEIAQVLCNIGENLKWQDEQIALTKKLLIYPLIVSTVVLGLVFFLMIYMVPQLMQFISSMGQEMPWHSKVLIVLSRILSGYWYLFFLLPLLLIAVMYTVVRINPTVQYYIDAIKLKFPIIGPVYKKIILARLTRLMAMMYASGITIIDCIQTGEKITGNLVIEKAVHGIIQSLVAGDSLSKGFTQAQIFPAVALRMIRIGESTGTLEKSLNSICYFYTRDVRESIERMQTMIEPAMTLLLGAVIGWLMYSILGPIYDLITQVRI